MTRPRHKHPTPAELEVLKILWERGDLTVRGVLDALGPRKRRAYTSVMSLLNVMTQKGYLVRRPQGRAFVYSARMDRDGTARSLLGDLLGRVFEGSASTLVAHLLEQSRPSAEELEAIHTLIERYQKEHDRS
jgi:predicted transcriptional regulator